MTYLKTHSAKRALPLIILFPALLLAGCGASSRGEGTARDLATIIRSERGVTPAPAKCEAPLGLVGKPHTELNAMKFDVPIRVIFPGSAVSSDQVSNRLNFKVDKKGIIKSFSCG